MFAAISAKTTWPSNQNVQFVVRKPAKSQDAIVFPISTDWKMR